MSHFPKSTFRIFRAPWVVPVSSAVICDGAVVTDGSTIVTTGSFSDIFSQYPDLPVTKCSGVLLPALVNAHIHLELSVYGVVYPPKQTSSMCEWINELLRTRETAQFTIDDIRNAATQTVLEQYNSGVALLLDIGNLDLGLHSLRTLEIHPLLEIYGSSAEATKTAVDTIEQLPTEQAVTGHAPYSTSPDLLQYIKKRSTQQNELFSLHVAENIDEALLLKEGKGCFAQFLKNRTGSKSLFPIAGIDSSSVVEYLRQLGLMDSQTIYVHCVHLSDKEIQCIADTETHVCLCSGSNAFLGVGTARLQVLLDHGILPALGTDSIASNPDINLWSEMVLLRKEHPDVNPEHILKMATYGGARAMGRESVYGSLQKGKTARILHVQDDMFAHASNDTEIIDLLTSKGQPDLVGWL